MKSEGTYPIPKHGWTCYHCGETFTVWGAAEDHFGKTPEAKPGCVLKVQFGNERGLEMELRKVEAERDEWRNRALKAEEHEELLEGEMSEYRRAAKADNCHQLRMNIDSLEGRAIAADFIVNSLRSRVPELVDEVVG
jgi:hypothetical protein